MVKCISCSLTPRDVIDRNDQELYAQKTRIRRPRSRLYRICILRNGADERRAGELQPFPNRLQNEVAYPSRSS